MKSKILLILLLGLCLTYARSEIPYVFEEEDFGNEALPKFLYALSVDCDTGQIRQEVFNEDVEPLEGVSSFLRYHDYATPLISSGVSNSNGVIMHQIPGDINHYTGLFILVIEETGYRNKEVHFEIKSCFEEKPEPAPEPYIEPVETPIVPNETIEEEVPAEPPEEVESEEIIVPEINETEPAEEEENPEGCAFPAALILLLGLFAFRKQ